MKLDEDLGLSRGDEVQTDDEENQAERICRHDDDSESDVTSHSRDPSSTCIDDVHTPTWPQSYRQSMDMLTSVTPPAISFLKRTSLTEISSSFSTAYKRQRISESSSLLIKPLISETSFDEEQAQISKPPDKYLSVSSSLNFSVTELPPQHRKCSFSQSVLNGVNVLCGVGLLTTPYAIREGGWLSLILLATFGLIACYTGILLKRCLESSPGLQTYPDIGQAAFGTAGRLTIAVILYIELYATCVEYLILLSDNLASLFPNTEMSISGIFLDCHQIFTIIATLIVLPTVWLRNLGLLSYLSVGGVIASVLVAICLLWIGVVDKVGFHRTGTALDVANLSVAVGIYGFGYSGHSVFPNIYSSMKEPSRFQLVLIASFIFCFVMYIGVAICGFLMFGEEIESQFTLNMPSGLLSTKIAVWTTVVSPVTKYALTLTPVVLGIEELLPSARLRSYPVSLLIRTVLVLSTLVVALTIPYFGLVMALIGSLLAMLVALIFPCVCYLRLLNGKLSKSQITGCALIIFVGVVCSITGTYSAISRIADEVA